MGFERAVHVSDGIFQEIFGIPFFLIAPVQPLERDLERRPEHDPMQAITEPAVVGVGNLAVPKSSMATAKPSLA